MLVAVGCEVECRVPASDRRIVLIVKIGFYKIQLAGNTGEKAR